MTPRKRTISVHTYLENGEPIVSTLQGRNVNFLRTKFKSDKWTLDGFTRDIYVTSEQFRNRQNNQDQTWNGFLKERIGTWFWILLAWAMLFATFYVIGKMMQVEK